MMRPPPPPPHCPQAPHMPYAPHMMQEEPQPQHFVSSRVCTPAPEPAAVDPMLMNMNTPAPMVPQMGNPTPVMGTPMQSGHATPVQQPKAVVIKLGVDELRALIAEAVQKAVEGLQAAKEVSVAVAVAEEEVGENIVVAGSVEVGDKGVGQGDDQVMGNIDFTC